MDEEIGIVKRSKSIDVQGDKINDELQKSLIEQALENMLKPGEVEYYLSLSKKNNLSEAMIAETYEKAIDTLEILMSKLGLKESFKRIQEQYQEEFE